MNIIVLEGMMSKGSEVTLGAGRGCMMKQGVNEKMMSTAMPLVRATKPLMRGATLKMDTGLLLAS